MVWNQIVAVLAILIAITYGIEQILLRVFRIRLPKRHASLLRDLVPVFVFVGILLSVFSAIEAYRREAIEPWLFGLAAGLLVSILALAAGVFQQNFSPRGAVSVLRTYGVIIAVTLIGMYLAVRVIGPTAQVFVEGASSVIVLGAAFAFSLRGRAESGAAKKS